MMEPSQLTGILARAAPSLQKRIGIIRKAVMFGLIGFLNAAVDTGVFFLAYAILTGSGAATRLFDAAADICHCGPAEGLILVAANVTAWMVAVTFSYAMNSTFTFAAESGRKLSLRAYLAFAGSGVLGVSANTATLVFAAQYVSVLAAKICALLVSFVVNFSMSHFVVFRPRQPGPSQGSHAK